MASKFVNVYSKTTGLKQRVPRAWLDHPTLGADFELTPSARAGEQATQMPDPTSDQVPQPLPVDETSTAQELLQYATENDIDLGDAQDEAEALAAIRKHHESPSAGEKE